ncbi:MULTISPECIES: helix-turn-helix domain-containing protein [unclassified Streptomyces]|uniref:helix-turn-helix domain-containing protein n=1 Tax=unclassified Streptomyces TaxID=2593676 RepID=UPI000997ECEF|nr:MULTISPECIES: helix-turn-helix transcriptional regulator [unclassified Streptomyces]
MPHRPHVPQPPPPTPPFDALAARRLRAALGMAPEHVAYGMRASFGLPYVTPDLVIAWEHGDAAPTSPELVALAGVLWCAPGELVGAPRTLREHRVARGLAPEDLARAVGVEPLAYVRMEEAGEWRGTDRQSAALADVLELSLPDFVTVTGRDARLAELLRGAVTTRWQGYVRQVGKVVPLHRRVIEEVLAEMHASYQGELVPTPVAGGFAGVAATASGDAGREFLERVVGVFWEMVGRG